MTTSCQNNFPPPLECFLWIIVFLALLNASCQPNENHVNHQIAFQAYLKQLDASNFRQRFPDMELMPTRGAYHVMFQDSLWIPVAGCDLDWSVEAKNLAASDKERIIQFMKAADSLNILAIDSASRHRTVPIYAVGFDLRAIDSTSLPHYELVDSGTTDKPEFAYGVLEFVADTVLYESAPGTKYYSPIRVAHGVYYQRSLMLLEHLSECRRKKTWDK